MYGLCGEKHHLFGKERPSIRGDKNPSKRKDVREKISLSKKGKPSSMLGKKHTNEAKIKIGKSNFGKIRRSETVEKIRIARKKQIGSKCPGWKGGKTKLVEKIRSSDEYFEWRKAVFERDKYTCLVCNKHGAHLHAHHIIGVYENLEMVCDINNGFTLCKDCHISFHNIYGRINFPNIKLILDTFKKIKNE